MKKTYFGVVVISVVAHVAYLVFLPSGGFLALRWRRTLWLHLPTVIWGVGVVSLGFSCPLTSLEAWARARAGMDSLPESGFTDHYLAGVVFPANGVGTAQKLAFLSAAVSWLALAIQCRESRVVT